MILKEATGRKDDISEIKRLISEHPHIREKAEKEIRNIQSGLSGEGSAAHFLDREFRDSNRVALLHDIRLDCGNGDFAQIDHLLIHRIQGIAWVLETKNYSGDISCDEHGDWIVFYNKRAVGIPSPIEQAKRQAIALERWFKAHEIKGINKIVPVVLTNPKARINRKHLRDNDHVIKSDNFARWYIGQTQGIGTLTALAMAGRFVFSGMDEMQLRLLGKRIKDAHHPITFDWEARFGVKNPIKNSNNAKSQKNKISEKHNSENKIGSIVMKAVLDNIKSSDNLLSIILNKDQIETPIGVIKTQTLSDGRIALRHDHNEKLSEALSLACKGKGQWNPRYRNWIVKSSDLQSIISRIR